MKMTNKEAIKRIKDFALYHAIRDLPNSAYTVEAFEMAIRALENQDRGVVSVGLYEQVRWERDVAISQLEELGYGLGEKTREEDKKMGKPTLADIAAKLSEFDSECLMTIDEYLESVENGSITDYDGYGVYVDDNGTQTMATDFDSDRIKAMKNLGIRFVCWYNK